MENVQQETRVLTKMAILVALIFMGTYAIKVPSLHGYTHPGDSMIFLTVLLLGTKKGALAGGLGAALADFAGGYVYWIIPTFFIKYGMALIMGLLFSKVFQKLKFGWLIGASIGGVFQIIGYTVFHFLLFDSAYAISELIPLTIQTTVGIAFLVIIESLLTKSNMMKKLKEM